MNLRRRLEALEKEPVSEPIITHMPDSSIETLPNHGDSKAAIK